MRLGLSSFIHRAEQAVRTEAQGVVRTVKAALPGEIAKLRTAALLAANPDFMTLTSTPNLGRVKQELALAKVASDPRASNAEARGALLQLRALMGAEPLDQLDPLPAACSTQAEAQRLQGAKVWDTRSLANAAPAWTTRGPGGKVRSDPVNLYVHGDLASIVRAFQQGGWSIADPLGPAANARYTKAVEGYLASDVVSAGTGDPVAAARYHAVNKMPVSTLYLDGQPELLAMEANNHPLTGREHFRIFWTGKRDAQGKAIYAIAASRDAGLKLDPKRKATAYTNHFTERNADRERDFVLQTLRASGARVTGTAVQQKRATGPAGGLYSQDGKVYDLTVG